eukprot:c9667_g1_i1.p1 GENE.c9667_g1_i1~~c9667_g1_i1.p1  ORF type:complete len:500 (-),score=118.10 c9667_g1_i1:71-1519(-)
MYNHKLRLSVLSSESDSFDSGGDANKHPTVGPVKYRGFLNAIGILLVLTNVRLVVENIKKYGLLIHTSVPHPSEVDFRRWPCLVATLCLPIFLLISLSIEKFAFHLAALVVKRLGKSASPTATVRAPAWMNIVWVLQLTNIAMVLYFPVTVIHEYHPSPGSNVLLLLFAVTWSLKLYSYAAVNDFLRREWFITTRSKAIDSSKLSKSESSGKSGEHSTQQPSTETSTVTVAAVANAVQYPANLKFKDILMFALFPTLCYQLNFPRTPRIRKRYLARRFLEFVVFSAVIFVICAQYIVPLLHNAILPWEEVDVLMVLERVLKLAVPNLYVWLIGFYVLFHVYLNILAELTCFGDRLFYLEWWNSTTIGHFWRTWNLPVHNFMKAHVFIPLVRLGFSKASVGIIAFLISAVLHEYIVSVTFYTTGYFAFLGMLLQIPAVQFSEIVFKNYRQAGNVFFWLTVLLGQPLITLFYYMDFIQRHKQPL